MKYYLDNIVRNVLVYLCVIVQVLDMNTRHIIKIRNKCVTKTILHSKVFWATANSNFENKAAQTLKRKRRKKFIWNLYSMYCFDRWFHKMVSPTDGLCQIWWESGIGPQNCDRYCDTIKLQRLITIRYKNRINFEEGYPNPDCNAINSKLRIDIDLENYFKIKDHTDSRKNQPNSSTFFENGLNPCAMISVLDVLFLDRYTVLNCWIISFYL